MTQDAVSSRPFATPDLADEFPDIVQALDIQWRSFGSKPAFCGPVTTIKCHEDNSLIKEAIASPGQGGVIVVDAGGSLRRGLLGDQQAAKAAANNWSGIILYGAVRDVPELATIDLGIFALGAHPFKTVNKGAGTLGEALQFGQARIRQGDWIYADETGILVAPHDCRQHS